MRHFLTLGDFSKEEIVEMLQVAIQIKKDFLNKKDCNLMHRKILGMIFEKNSTRTRVSFEAGIYQLGGTGIFLSNKEIQLSRGESIADTARVIGSMVDMVMIRTFEHSRLEEFAKHCKVPVINGLSDLYHPTQVMADYLTMIENGFFIEDDFKEYSYKAKPKVAYIGDGNNMTHSWMMLAAKMGFDISIATPREYAPNKEVVQEAQKIAKKSGSNLFLCEDPIEAISQCNVVVTDTWVSMGQEDQKEKKQEIFHRYKIDNKMMQYADSQAIFLHCLPAYRGQEVSSEVIDGEQSRVFQEAENRLHAQKGIMVWLYQNSKR
ncbi:MULTISPECIES: ornithine carbamoyltransferase [unclassified Helicobacter]|uniref:ornithine carbamoyltransferase n=1 Tax=unclassified Helicobacter TaxID=2593540 RepID=UPI000CF07EE2|nr:MULTISPECIES: ornithine carbamoyltransferase [unclassified Helicobacter]